MKAKKTWIVLANGARARIAAAEGIGKGVVPALDREFAGLHVPTHALVSDRPGRYSNGRRGRTHGVAPRTDRHTFEKMLFARDVAAVVEEGVRAHAFDRLILVAPPAALGRLRNALSPRTRQLVAAEVSKDLFNVPLKDLAGHLAQVIAV